MNFFVNTSYNYWLEIYNSTTDEKKKREAKSKLVELGDLADDGKDNKSFKASDIRDPLPLHGSNPWQGARHENPPRKSMSDTEKQGLHKLGNPELVDRFDDTYWDAQSINAFAAEFRRRGKNMRPEQTKVVEDAVKEARSGRISGDTAMKLLRALDQAAGQDKAGNTVVSRMTPTDLAALSDRNLARAVSNARWDAGTLEALKKEYIRRASADGTVDQAELRTINEAFSKAKNSRLSERDAARLYAGTTASPQLVSEMAGTSRNTWTAGQRDEILDEIERRAKNDRYGYQPGEKERLEKLRNSPVGTLHSDDIAALSLSLPLNAGDTETLGAKRARKIRKDDPPYDVRVSSHDSNYPATYAVKAAYVRTELLYRLGLDGKLTAEEKAAVDAYANALKAGRNAAREWDKVRKMLPY